MFKHPVRLAERRASTSLQCAWLDKARCVALDLACDEDGGLVWSRLDNTHGRGADLVCTADR